MNRPERIAAAIKHSGKLKKVIAKECGVTSSAVTQWVTGDSKSMKPENLFALARATGVNAEWLANGTGEMLGKMPIEHANVEPVFRPSKKPSIYPVISWIAAGERSQSPEHYVPGSGLAFESDQNAGQYGYWLEVKGGSMTSATSPSFLPGTYVLVQPEGFDLVSGKYYIAQHRDGETTFKQYVYDAGREYLVPLNPSFETIRMDDDWDVIGRVVDVKITGL